MEGDITIEDITKEVENASTGFEKTNTELKRKYLIWNINAFNLLASQVSVHKGSFGTGYPFYALDDNLEGTIPIINEQIRYNRQLIRDGEPFQKSIWLCKSCLQEKYSQMPDLKKVCRPCPNMVDKLKPRKIINRLPDLDMWLVCEDGSVNIAQEELSRLLRIYDMHTSDVNPLRSIDDITQISEMLKSGVLPKIFLPIDTHIIEYSKLKKLIETVPEVLKEAKEKKMRPYLPIQPKSYRKQWQYDDDAYNFIYDYLSAFSAFNFSSELQQALDSSRLEVSSEYNEDELFEFLMQSATESNFRRFQSIELEDYFTKRVKGWKTRDERQQVSAKKKQEYIELEKQDESKIPSISDDDEMPI